VTGRLRLADGVILARAADLPVDRRGGVSCAEDDWIITRPGLRSSSHLLDAQGAGLLAEFRTPSTLVEAALRHCRSSQADPESVLHQAHPLVAGLLTIGVLVEEGDAERGGLLPALELGTSFSGFEILHCERTSRDTELYQARRGLTVAALRIERAPDGPGGGAIEREAVVLRTLGGQGAPLLLAAGRWQGRRFLAAEWCEGVAAGKAAEELRAAGDRAGLAALRRSISKVYEHLHAAGVRHGAVHGNHVLVAADGQVRLIDFQQAERSGAAGEPGAVAGLLDSLAAGGRPPGPRTAVPALLARTLERLRTAGGAAAPHLPPLPSGGIARGLAGVPLALLCLARARRESGLLAAADRWITAAVGACRQGELAPDPDGAVSPFRSATGLWSVEALIAGALGDRSRLERALAELAAAARPAINPDLYFGRLGLLLACALLYESCPEGPEQKPAAALRTLGEEITSDVWRELDALPPIAHQPRETNLGLAHGWAGFLSATLAFHRATGSPLPPRLRDRLGELAGQAVPWGRGMRWRWPLSDPWPGPMPTMAGWCNGSAGMVFLWSQAYRIFAEPEWLELARKAAWDTWDAPAPPGIGGLCCGLAGRSYALLSLYRLGEGRVWLERSRELARRAAEEIAHSSEPQDSLYRGELGVAVLLADLEHPEEAAMPFFESRPGVPPTELPVCTPKSADGTPSN
jgi:predicted Ser/Thr protein kinase